MKLYPQKTITVGAPAAPIFIYRRAEKCRVAQTDGGNVQ